MDIFTTLLTRVVPVTIKPEKLKVKGLSKEAKSRKLDQEDDHNDGHELHSITQQYAQEHYQQDNKQAAQQYTAKEEISPAPKTSDSKQVEQSKDDSDEPPHHLDIFV